MPSAYSAQPRPGMSMTDSFATHLDKTGATAWMMKGSRFEPCEYMRMLGGFSLSSGLRLREGQRMRT